MLRNSIWLSIIMFVIPGCAAAQWNAPPNHREWDLAVFAGGSFLGDSRHATSVEGEGQPRSVGLHYGAGGYFGLRVSENRWDHFGASLEYGFSNQPLSFVNLTPDRPSVGLGHSIHRFVYDLSSYPMDRRARLRPFGFAGVGTSLFHVDGSSKSEAAAAGVDLKDSWKLVFSWGAGVKYLLRDQVAVSFQFSDRISGTPGYGLPRSARIEGDQFVPGFRPSGLLNNWSLDIAFVYQWGRRLP